MIGMKMDYSGSGWRSQSKKKRLGTPSPEEDDGAMRAIDQAMDSVRLEE
jgi:hypothetical protein